MSREPAPPRTDGTLNSPTGKMAVVVSAGLVSAAAGVSNGTFSNLARLDRFNASVDEADAFSEVLPVQRFGTPPLPMRSSPRTRLRVSRVSSRTRTPGPSSPDGLSNSWLRLVQLDPYLDRGLPEIHKKLFSRVNLLAATGESPIE